MRRSARNTKQSQPENGVPGWRCLALVPMLLSLVVCRGAVAAEGDPAAGKRKTITCNGCHGQAGMKNMPSLGGQSQAYFIAAMQAYQDGIRTHATMRDVAKSYSLQELKNFAAYYAESSAAPADAAGGGAPPPAAERCAVCHGGGGAEPVTKDVPRVAGQKAAYLAQAMRDYRSGARRQAIMQQQAAELGDGDIEALSVYYAAQPGLFVK
jgi:cytochrome c553